MDRAERHDLKSRVLLFILLFFFSLFLKEGREKEKRITKVMILSHAFLLDHYLFIKYRQLFNGRCDKILVSIHTVLMDKQSSIFSLYVLILFGFRDLCVVSAGCWSKWLGWVLVLGVCVSRMIFNWFTLKGIFVSKNMNEKTKNICISEILNTHI